MEDVPDLPGRAVPVWFRHARLLHGRISRLLPVSDVSVLDVGRGMDGGFVAGTVDGGMEPGMRGAIVVPSLDRFTQRYAIPAGRFAATDTFKAWATVWERVYEEHPDGFLLTPDARVPLGVRRLAIADRIRTHGLTQDTEAAILRYYEDLATALQRRKTAAVRKSR